MLSKQKSFSRLCLHNACSCASGAIAVIENLTYDETPLHIRACFADDGPGIKLSKLFVVESANYMLLRHPQWKTADPNEKYLCLQFPASIQVRVGERSNGENIRNILCDTSLWPERVSLFRLRVAESDQLSANIRAERLFASGRRRQRIPGSATPQMYSPSHSCCSEVHHTTDLETFSGLLTGGYPYTPLVLGQTTSADLLPSSPQTHQDEFCLQEAAAR